MSDEGEEVALGTAENPQQQQAPSLPPNGTNGDEKPQLPQLPPQEKARHSNMPSRPQSLPPIEMDASSSLFPFVLKFERAVDLGLAALRYGAGGIAVERFLNGLLLKYVSQSNEISHAVVRISNTELFCSIVTTESQWPVTVITDMKEGYHLDKLSRWADLAQALLQGRETLATTPSLLDDIASAPDPYGVFVMGLAWVFVGFGLPPVLGGTWLDAGVGSLLGLVCYLTYLSFAKYAPPSYQNPWNNVFVAFVAGAISAGVNLAVPQLNVIFTILSGIAFPLPGYTVSLGVAELADGRVVAGMAHLVGGLVTLGWLLLGAFVGVIIVDRPAGGPGLSPDEEDGTISTVPPKYWQALFVPMLCASLAVGFQTSYKDVPWSILCQGIAFCLVVAFGYIPTEDGTPSSNLGIVVSSVGMTLFSNAWSRLRHKPTQILLVPAIVLQVSGTIGFRGIISIGIGDKETGTQQFLQMFLVAMMIFLGVAVGMSILPPSDIL
mmetsp:Transcript_13927/g.22410  ORF Transcript_13927/g.22410 Transcript_13927/m.22410 type:complete len:494 (-) Transcript_13927:1504-2985(-)